MRLATLIYNPVAGSMHGRRERHLQEAVSILRDSNIIARLARTSGPGSATALAQAAASGDDLVIACGGDGTLNEVANGLTPCQIPLGILPGGTANIMARELGLPRHPVRAARALGQWVPRRIALGRVTGRPLLSSPGTEDLTQYFLSVAGVGFDAYIIHRLVWQFKMSFGILAYFLEALRQTMRYPFPSISCQINGRQHSGTFAIVQRTSRYAGWFHTAPGQSFTRPHFAVSLYKSRRRFRYFIYMAAALARLQLSDMDREETQRAGFSSEHSRVYFEVDGELAGMLPAHFEIVPEALTLLVPSPR